jgi:hypothetical protein
MSFSDEAQDQRCRRIVDIWKTDVLRRKKLHGKLQYSYRYDISKEKLLVNLAFKTDCTLPNKRWLDNRLARKHQD